ncbi:hypothetical protein [Actinomadura sp. 3N407]|uniref:hypothetical protein n=1 Tax=Actinomadura sp. 3N407 TaxID=3457423 RepID=UPI003FCE0059
MSSPLEDSHPPGDRRRRFEEIYTANRARILGYALRRTADPQDAAARRHFHCAFHAADHPIAERRGSITSDVMRFRRG